MIERNAISLVAACCLVVAAAARAQQTGRSAGEDSKSVGQRQVEATGDADPRRPRAIDVYANGTVAKYFDVVANPREKGAWIGISASPAAPAIRHQLKLRPGIGLVVDYVEPKSPAAEAGVEQYDVLEKLDDQLLVNTEQFAVLVRTSNPNDEVKLTVFREGKRQTITVKLTERELPNLQLNFNPQYFEFNQNQPNPHGFNVEPHILTQPQWNTIELTKPYTLSVNPQTSLRWLDDDHDLTIISRDGHSTLVSKDKAGKTRFEGPIDTKEQREALPTDLRDTLKKLKLPGDQKHAKSDKGDTKQTDVEEEKPSER